MVLEQARFVNKIDLGFFRSTGYSMAKDIDGSGEAVLPVIKIVDKRFRDLYLTYIDNEMNSLIE